MDTGRTMAGATLAGAGALLLLDQAGALDAREVMSSWWPVLLLGAAAIELLVRPRRTASAIVFAVMGFALLTVTTGWLDASIWSLIWPTVLLLLGLWLLLRPSAPRTVTAVSGRDRTSCTADVSATAMFSERRVVASPHRPFRQGSATALFGAVEIDLSDAVIEEEARLDLVAVFGGVDVTVPLGWRVLIEGPAIFGGYDSHVPTPPEPDAPTLRIHATAVFGGVDVKAVVTRTPEPVAV